MEQRRFYDQDTYHISPLALGRHYYEKLPSPAQDVIVTMNFHYTALPSSPRISLADLIKTHDIMDLLSIDEIECAYVPVKPPRRKKD